MLETLLTFALDSFQVGLLSLADCVQFSALNGGFLVYWFVHVGLVKTFSAVVFAGHKGSSEMDDKRKYPMTSLSDKSRKAINDLFDRVDRDKELVALVRSRLVGKVLDNGKPSV